MIHHKFLLAALACLLFVSFTHTCFPLSAKTSSLTQAARDHLTPPEADLVREEQSLERRTNVFIKAIERRLLVLTDPNAAASKLVQKDQEKWGELPKGTRPELLSDIAKILDEATTNIDNVSQRDAKNPLLVKSLRNLSEASTRFLAQLTAMRAAAQSDDEREAIAQAIDNAQSIIAAAAKLPLDEGKGKKAKDKG
jgi:hypothetical protein